MLVVAGDDVHNKLFDYLVRQEWNVEFVLNNEEDSVTWIHSYVSDDGKKTYCAYDAPSPEAIRRTARRNNLPVDRITEVRVLDPYFYR